MRFIVEPQSYFIGYIYKISSKKTGRIYIGSSEDVNTRWRWHLQNLATGTHHTKGLQLLYNSNGLEDLLFEVIEKVRICSYLELLILEGEYIRSIPSKFIVNTNLYPEYTESTNRQLKIKYEVNVYANT